MSRSKHSQGRHRTVKLSKGGYKLNRNGMPLTNDGVGALNSKVATMYHYKGTLHVGHYRPTVHNISII